LFIVQARLHARPRGTSQQNLSAPHDPVGADRLQPRLHARRDRRPSEKEGPPAHFTLSTWLEEYHQHCSYRRLRRAGLARFPVNQTIRSIKLYHRQIYSFAFHRPKLELVRDGMLDDKRAGDTRFAPLADFLESIPTTCPHDFFRRDDDPKGRASQAHPAFADVSRIIVNHKQNAATDTAALIIPAVDNNKLRHETLQHFILANDSVTVAVEIPIWLTEKDIAGLEREHGIELAPHHDGADRAITSHIDFLQVRNGAVHVLDYKPDARTNKPIAQLAIYALALTRLVPGLRLFDIKCAWFNEEEYCSSLERSSPQLGEKVRHSQKKPVEYRGSRDCLTFLLSYSNSNMFGFPYGALKVWNRH
jgi:hypothetical protein